jgi:Peptidase family M23
MLRLAALLLATLPPRQAPVEVTSPMPPLPVVTGGRRVLAYELHVTNFGQTPLTLTRIEVSSAGVVLATYSDSALASMLYRVGSPMMDSTHDAARLEPGQRLIAFLWIAQPSDAPLPVVLSHRLTFGESTIDRIEVPVRQEAAPILSPPVLGGVWLAGDGPSNASGHRRSVVPLNGAAHIAQRFAIDWVEVGENGNTVHDDPSHNENFWDYGVPVHAVADGEVTDLVDSVAENVARSPLRAFTIANVAGNYVIIRIAPRRYVLFAHLKPGSIRVRLRQRVRTGDVLGLIGNTGQATGPHLHMQVMDASSPLGSEGVPFVFRAYTSFGSGNDFEEDHHPTTPKGLEMPFENEVLTFR